MHHKAMVNKQLSDKCALIKIPVAPLIGTYTFIEKPILYSVVCSPVRFLGVILTSYQYVYSVFTQL